MAAVAADTIADVQPMIERWQSASATLALPVRLIDEQVRYAVLAHGKLNRLDADRAAERDETLLELTDQWNDLLDRVLRMVWVQVDTSLIAQESGPAAMKIGDAANRSEQLWPIGSDSVYVLQARGQPWTVGTALATLSAFAGLELTLSLLPRDLQSAPLLAPVDLTQSVIAALEQLLGPYGLIIQRDLLRHAGTITERRAVRPGNLGRTVHLAWATDNRALGQVLKIDADRPAEAAQPWIARADGWLVESTFELKRGWDPALEGEPDETYSRSNNPDFSTYANVFRLWVLNEDGHFTDAPYNQGPAFDLASLFGGPPLAPQPLRFLPGLTLDDAGARRSVIVEMSEDSGQTWLIYPGPVKLLTKRAAVYLDNTTLPDSFLTAAKAGTAVIRVTASLQSPIPIEVLHWRGNPFAGTLSAKLFDVGDAFGFRRIAPQSIHYNAVQVGDLIALTSDQTNQLNDWLLARMHREDRAPRERTGQATLELVGAWPVMRVGDRLHNTMSRGVDSAGRAEAIARKGATVRAVRCRWRGPDATTTVDLSF
ncbi:MAG: hypothetical protein V3U29_06405 [Phycisphaeraceae bacterium]